MSTEAQAGPDGPDGSGRPDGAATVLVVDDTPLNRVTLARGVERLGHAVLQAADGAEALEVLAAERVDMVLLDLLMPGVDGFEVLRRVHADPDLATVPVLVVSAIEETEDVARAIELGAIDCLPKPFDPVLLRVRVRVALEQARLRGLEQEYLRQEMALRQQERLATIGRLSAGLGHELNNPAAAALGASRQLLEQLVEADRVLPALLALPDGGAAASAVEELMAGTSPEGQARDELGAMDLADDLEEALTALGVPGAWSVAPDLAAFGVAADALQGRLALLDGPAAGQAVAWLAIRVRVRRLADMVSASVARMAELTQALRGYSNLDRAPRVEVDVRESLEETLTMLGHRTGEGVRVVRDYADVPVIEAYGAELNQVWTNLVDNALDAVGDAGAVVVRVRPGEDGWVVVEVEDDGPGVPDELQGRVFEAFFTTKEVGEGPGLGLTTAHQIVTGTHGGRMGLESGPGRTVLRVELPPVPTGG